MEETVTFCCPSCLQHTAVTVHLAAGRQQMTEDCQNCCEPVALDIDVRGGQIQRFDYRLENE